MTTNPKRDSVSVPAANPMRNPGDEARPGATQTGEVICPDCSGSGRIQGADECPNCGGTGKVVQIIGDA